MPVTIPMRQDLARWSSQVVLGDTYAADGVSFTDGRLFTFGWSWNGRASCWSLTIRDQDDTVLLAGKALRLGCLLLRQYGKASGLPPGDLLLVDLTGTHTEASLTSLGLTTQLLYYTSGELATAGL